MRHNDERRAENEMLGIQGPTCVLSACGDLANGLVLTRPLSARLWYRVTLENRCDSPNNRFRSTLHWSSVRNERQHLCTLFGFPNLIH